MKCPHCDAEMSAQKKCGKCGFEVADDRDEVEVEYKDFKTSELLEIRHRKQTAPPAAGTNISAEQSAMDAVKGEIPASTPSPETRKSPLPALTVVVLILALLIVGFFILRFLVQH